MVSPWRGEVWWIDYGTPIGHEQGGRRPGLVVSADGVAGFQLVITAPITRTEKPYPTRVRIDKPRSPSFVQVEQLRTTSVERFARIAGNASEAVMDEVDRILRYVFELRP
jgi:mRNA interferase MazF